MTKKFQLNLAIAAIFATITLLAGTSQAEIFEVDPRDKFKVLKTPHFDIIFNANQQELAQHYALRLEKAHDYFAAFLSQMPGKTAVIINDKTDDTNGYSTRIPYPHMMLYPVLPGADNSLSEYSDWAYEFVAHEYTHILTFEPSRGVVSVLRGVFGTIISPNILLPQWWKEGVAVEMETRVGQGGRLRSKYQDAITRALVDEKTFLNKSVDLANENLPFWPEGLHSYVFGSYFFSQALAEHSPKLIDDLLVGHSGRLPYFIDMVAENNLKRDYEAYYNKALRDVQTRALRQLTTIREYETTRSQAFDKRWVYSSAPTFNANGDKLVIYALDDRDETGFRLYTRAKGQQWRYESKAKLPTGRVQDAKFFNHSDRIVFGKLETPNRYRSSYELFIFDFNTTETVQLTESERAREAAPSPSDKEIAYISVADGRTELKIIEVESKKITSILRSELQERYANPTWLNENELVLSKKISGGDEVLIAIDRHSKKVRKIQETFRSARLPTVHQGQLFFTAAKNGVYNLYTSKSEKETAQPITNTTSIILGFDLSALSSQMAVTEITASGPQVRMIDAKDWQKTPRKLAQIDALLADRYPLAISVPSNSNETHEAEPTESPVVQIPPEPTQNSTLPRFTPNNYTLADYEATSYLLPHYWIPFVATSNTGFYLQALTSNFDPLKKHSYAASINYDTYLKKGGWMGTYQNAVWPLPWSLTTLRSSRSLGNADNIVETDSYSFSILPDSWWIQKSSSLALGLIHSTDTYLDSRTRRSGVFANYLYSDFTAGKRQVSPLQGFGYYLDTQHFIQSGDQIAYTEAEGSVIGFLAPSFLPRRHALMGKLSHSQIFESVSAIYGVSSSNFFLASDQATPTYVLRGYGPGQFFGKTVTSANLEYRFPIHDIYQGKGTDPYFFQRIRGAVVADAMSVDGLGIERENRFYYRLRQGTILYAAGVEAKLDMSLGYILPLTISMGYFVGQNKDFANGGSFNLNVLLGAFY